MRICYLADASNYTTVKWVKHFLSLGHEVYVISNGRGEIPGAKIYYVDYSLGNFVIYSKMVHKLIRRIDPDILHAHKVGVSALYAVTCKEYKSIISVLGADFLNNCNKGLARRNLVKYILKNASYIICDSKYIAYKMEQWNIKKEKLLISPMGIEKELLKSSATFELFNDELRIISTKKLEKKYNIDLLLKGFAEALKVEGRLFLTVASLGPELEHLKELVRELNIREQVNFVGGYNREQLHALMERNQIFISIPDYDGTSIRLLEAMSCGLFPIVSPIPVNKELIRNKDNGYFLKEISVEEIKKAILWSYTNRKNLKQRASQNVDIIRNKALWEENVKEIEKLYNDIYEKRI